MPVTISDTTKNPLPVLSGEAVNPFASINVQSPLYTTWDTRYGGGSGILSIQLRALTGSADIGNLTDPGIMATNSRPISFDPSTNTFTEQTFGGPTVPGFLSPADTAQRIIYTAPPVAEGHSKVIAATLSFSDVQSNGAAFPTPTNGGTVALADPVPVLLTIGQVTTIGTGPDTFLFTVSEDAWQGDAQFAVNIDDVQQGGVLTATSAHAVGDSQIIAVNGDFGNGAHTASVHFLNDAWGGSGTTDRNLFVDAASFNGQVLTPDHGALFTNGALDFIRPAPIDTLTISMTEDAWQGDAQAQINIDGKILGTVTVTAARFDTPQQVTFKGDFGSGAHNVGVAFLNDAWGGTDTTDRNLFVNSISLNGVAEPATQGTLFTNGVLNVAIQS